MTTARLMELRWWLLCSAATLLLFSLWPALDLQLTAQLHDPAAAATLGTPFPWGRLEPARWSYVAVPWLGRAMLLAGLLALGLGVWRRRSRRWCSWQLRWQRRMVALLLVVLVGLGLAVNFALKEGWGRARPHQVTQFGGERSFTPIWQPSRQCDTNCSFVSGHAATGFVLIGVGMLAAPATRRRWLAIGWSCGLLIGAGRVLQGDHFASDVLCAGLVIWGVSLLMRELWLRRRALRRSRRRGGAIVLPAPVGAAQTS